MLTSMVSLNRLGATLKIDAITGQLVTTSAVKYANLCVAQCLP